MGSTYRSFTQKLAPKVCFWFAKLIFQKRFLAKKLNGVSITMIDSCTSRFFYSFYSASDYHCYFIFSRRQIFCFSFLMDEGGAIGGSVPGPLRAGPVQFEREDPFGLDQFLDTAKRASGKRSKDDDERRKDSKKRRDY